MKSSVCKLTVLALALLLVGCTVQVQPTAAPAALESAQATTAASAAAAETVAPQPSAAEKTYSEKDFLSDPGMPNSREALTAKWPEFAKDHQVRIVCFEMGWTGPVKEKDFITPEIAKRTGINLIYEPMITNSTEELNAKLNLMVSSGEVPEIYFGGSEPYDRDVYEKLGQAGLLYDMAPYIAKYPLINNLLKPELIKFSRTDATGSHNWFLPTQTGRGNDLLHSAVGGLFVRKDFLDKLGIDYPVTVDGYVTYLRRCRDEIKTVNGKPVIPFMFEENLGGAWSLMSIYMPMENTGFGFDWENNFKPYNYQYTNSPELKRGLMLLNALYTEGLIDKESVSIQREQYASKASSGRVASMTGASWDTNTFADIAATDVPDIMLVESKPLQDPAYPVKQRKWTYWIGCYSALTVSSKLDEDTVRHFCAFMDYLATTEGQILVSTGLPGKSFEMDANGKFKFTDAFKNETSDLDWNKVAATGVYYWQQLVMNVSAIDPLQVEYPGLVRKDNYASYLNQEGRTSRFDADMMPTKDYYVEPGPIQSEKMVALDDAFSKLVLDCVLAGSAADVEKLVDAYGLKCKELGIDEVMAERQALIDAIIIPES